jgi:hypothetical protein
MTKKATKIQGNEREAEAVLCSREDGYCYSREDRTHCKHWWDGKPCCGCGFNGGEVDGAD